MAAEAKILPGRDLWQAIGQEGLGQPGRPSEGSADLEFRRRGAVEDQWGRSESLDPDNTGDIADEGAGHRG